MYQILCFFLSFWTNIQIVFANIPLLFILRFILYQVRFCS